MKGLAAVRTPPRLKLAQLLCRRLPPLVSQRVRSLVYPQKVAFADKHEFVVAAQTGSLFAGSTCDFHAYPFAVHGYYEWRNWAVAMAVCSPGDTIVEVGANVGTETVGFRDIVGATGHVHAFEPMPANLQALRRLVGMNGWTNVTVHPVALGAQHMETEFVLPEHEWASGVGHLRGPGEVPRGGIVHVKVVPLDSMSQSVEAFQGLFIDTEGAEVDVLIGAKGIVSACRPTIVLEASPRLLSRAGRTMDELYQVLVELGYRPCAVTRFGLADPSKVKLGKAANWVCLPQDPAHLASRICRYIRVCGLLPCVAGLNPMTKRRPA
ncbi:MAG: FkbM family methyltransferase [Armatimonadota bacterium]